MSTNLFDEYGRPIQNDVYEEETKQSVLVYNKKKDQRLRTAGLLCAMAIMFGTVAGGSFYGVNALLSANDNGTTMSTAVSTLAAKNEGSLDVSAIAKATLPSVVSITNKSVQEVQDWFSFFYGGSPYQLQESTSAGSGIIIKQTDDALYIVTNYHVVKGANTLSATFIDESMIEAEYVGGDEANDIALIKVPLSSVSKETMEEIRVAEIGDSDQLEVGEQVIAIGNALGYGQSVTTGIVSAVDRSLTTSVQDSSMVQDTVGTTETFIQTDAAINPGNSGGALLNMDGQVIGINTAKLSSTEVEGMGYAIPISRVAEIVNEIFGNYQTGNFNSI